MSKATLSTAPVIQIPFGQIGVAFNIRSRPGSVVSLKQSIDDLGMIHPIVVTNRADLCKKIGKKYVLVSGGRRLAALKLLRAAAVPARIVPDSDVDNLLQIQTDENEQRQDLDQYDASLPRYNAVRDEIERLLAGAEGKPTLRTRVQAKSEALKSVGVSSQVHGRDKKVVGIVKRYPELERWSQRPMLAAAEALRAAKKADEKGLRRLAASWPAKAAPQAAQALANLVDNWPDADRKALLKRAATDPEGAQSVALGVPPVPDQRLVGLGTIRDDLKQLMAEFRKRDEAQEEMRIAMDHLTTAYRILRHAYDLSRDEFSTYIEG